MSTTRMRLGALVTAGVLSFSLAACGDDEPDTTDPVSTADTQELLDEAEDDAEDDAADTTPADLAREGLNALIRARARRAEVPSQAAPALLAGWRAGPVLARALADPRAAGRGLETSEFRARATLLMRAVTGHW